ncbi:carbamoyl phosphate synthase small subunit [Blautia liquoris]|uniref:Carbamoyl phosphate synthase small chain n=1 Tax=Blautia liquoris TaxID=2779518 RepID=A0A7M2RJ66_9FIRM|nr:carbamoyl phosphate synthase small subunit [Blautia liquoris]QOV20111.1 carbamoyl phosphate synthase small subunit [Blautia liquoris]
MKTKTFLILEDGHIFSGIGIGSPREVISEIVFNTSMTGYPEILTDPSYAGQAVCMTYPLIGNYGICYEDRQSNQVWPDALIAREFSRTFSNFRSQDSIQNYLKSYDIPAIEGIDTRALAKVLREHGTMNGMVTTNSNYDLSQIIPKLKKHKNQYPVRKVTCSKKQIFEGTGFKVALMDFGAKKNIVDSLRQLGCEVTIYPAFTKAEEIFSDKPDGIILSNGPGDPREYTDIVREVRKIYDFDIPVFAICLGHQLMALAAGLRVRKMKYGHRGANHPVRNQDTGRVSITSQNHGYVVDSASMDERIAVPSYINVNDNSIEGLKYVDRNIVTVQFHPEASPGPQDTRNLFNRFIEMMGGHVYA